MQALGESSHSALEQKTEDMEHMRQELQAQVDAGAAAVAQMTEQIAAREAEMAELKESRAQLEAGLKELEESCSALKEQVEVRRASRVGFVGGGEASAGWSHKCGRNSTEQGEIVQSSIVC
jgi:predicted nuclease with TOPRIM domain